MGEKDISDKIGTATIKVLASQRNYPITQSVNPQRQYASKELYRNVHYRGRHCEHKNH